jgi:hypothetical protein
MSGVELDLSITLGNIIEIGVICAGGVSALAVMRHSVRNLKDELSDMKQDTKDQFSGIESEIKKIGEVLINQADQNRRIIHLEEDVRDLRHGRGFVRGPTGIDREYE